MALCGVLAALAVVLLSFGALIPFSTFCCPILAMLCMIPVVEEYGRKSALLFYGAVSVLALLLAPDKEVALLFTFLGMIFNFQMGYVTVLISHICFCVPLVFCLSRFTAITIIPLFFIAQATDLVKCVLGAYMLKQGKWIQNLTV